MRERTFINQPIPGGVTGRAKAPDSPEYTYSERSGGGRVYDAMWDVVTPNFHKLVAQGVIINNPMRRVTSEISGGYGTRSAIGKGSNTGGYNYMSGDVFGNISEADGFQGLTVTLDESNNALLEAFSNIDSTPYSFGEDLAELKETLQLLRNPLQSMKDLVTEYRITRANEVLEGKPFLKAHANAWAAVRFGLSPLLQSAYNLAEGIANYKTVRRPLRMTSRGFAMASKVDGDSKVFGGTRRYMRYVKKDYTIRASVLYEPPAGELSVNAYFGLRAKDIPETMWNVIPYSFMVDRFVDISALTRAYVNLFDPGVKILSACTVERRSCRQMYNVVDDPSPIYNITWGCAPRLIIDTEVVRTPQPINQAPAPVLQITKPLSSLVNLADISALLLQRIR